MTSKTDAMRDRIAGLSIEKRALLEKLLEKGGGDHGKPAATAPPRIRRRPAGSDVPLSFAQQRLWFFEQLVPGTSVYNMPLQLRLQFALDAGALTRALNELVRRHEILRTTFKNVEGKPVQIVAPALELDVPSDDLSALAPDELEARQAELAAIEGLKPFDLTTGPLLRARILRRDAQDYVLLLTMHHIVSDSWSMNIFFRELSALYAAFAAGKASPLAELPIQYGDFAVWQRNLLQGEVLERQLAHWKKHLEGLAPVNLPYDRPRPAVASFRGAYVPVHVPPQLLGRLREISREHDCTLFITMLAAFQVLLFRYTGAADVVVGTPVANRNHAEIEELIGFFINSLIMRTSFAGNPTFREALGRVREVALEAYANQDVPFEMLVEELQPERDLTRNPLFQVLFQIQSLGKVTSDSANAPGGAPTRDNAVFDLNANLWEMSDAITGALEYNTDLFDEATVARMVSHYGVLLEAIAADPDRPVNDLPLLTDEERRQLLFEWNSTARDYPKDQTVVELFEEQAARTPEAAAVASKERVLTYAGLEERANRLARRLLNAGAGREHRIGILLERSIETIVAIMGILKAGAIYVPLDPEYPQERINFMLRDSGVRTLITQRSLAARVPHDAHDPLSLIVLDEEEEAPAEVSCPDLPDARSVGGGESAAYIIYTSGSTGTPKGVCVSHRSLINSTWARLTHYREPVGNFLLLSPFAFDSSVAGIFWTLSSGGCLHIATRDALANPPELAFEIERRSVTHILTVPSLYTHLLDALALQTTRLRVVVVAGETCTPALVRRHFERLPGVSLHNEYGPTEASVWATVHECKPEDAHASSLPVGRPVANMRAYVIDGGGEPQPPGVAGELWLGGEGVARGYWNRPELTAERFIPDRFQGAGARVYRTGDLARYLADGRLEFVGRLDEQVKVRGYRIELAEIDAALLAHPSVAECAAFVWKYADDARLAVWAVARGERVDIEELIEFLRERLPDYMVPRSITWVDALPRNANGKLDRAALTADPENACAAYVAPQGEVEEIIAALYKELLGVEKLSVHDNFYRLGGHSLLATQLLSRVNTAFQLELQLPVMFEAATVAALAEVVEQSLFEEIAALPDQEVQRLVGSQPDGA